PRLRVALTAASALGGLRLRGRGREARPRFRGRLGQGHEPGPVRLGLTAAVHVTSLEPAGSSSVAAPPGPAVTARPGPVTRVPGARCVSLRVVAPSVVTFAVPAGSFAAAASTVSARTLVSASARV